MDQDKTTAMKRKRVNDGSSGCENKSSLDNAVAVTASNENVNGRADESTNSPCKDEEYFVQRVIDKRMKNNQVEYLIETVRRSWEPVGDLHCGNLVEQFERSELKKKHERNGENDQNDDEAVCAGAVAIVDPQNQQQRAEIMKLDIDCFEETFDYLPAKDLISVGKTCKRLQRVTGFCFNSIYSNVNIECTSNGFQAHLFENVIPSVNHFAPYIRKIRIRTSEGLEYLSNVQSKLRRLQQIKMHKIQNVTESEVNRVTEILGKVEVLHLIECAAIWEKVNVHCSNLQHLIVKDMTLNTSWLVRKIPSLKSFESHVLWRKDDELKKITLFLELNPNVRKFATSAKHLLALRDFMKSASGIKLDELAIKFEFFSIDEFVSVCQLLNELYERGVYKRLLLYISNNLHLANQRVAEKIDQLVMVNGLVKLYLHKHAGNFTLSMLQNLEELYFDYFSKIANFKSLTNDLSSLKRMHFGRAYFNDIMVLTKRVPALHAIRVDELFHQKSIDLPALNRERQQLPNARKITLYVEEKVYLATKWALGETNFDFIRLKRHDSFEWQHDFGY